MSNVKWWIPGVPNKIPSPAGFNVETVEYKNINFTVWDVGRGERSFAHPKNIETLTGGKTNDI